MILWLDDYAVRKPVNKNYFPLTQPFRRVLNSVDWWRLLGFILCALSATATISAIGYAINCGTGVVR